MSNSPVKLKVSPVEEQWGWGVYVWQFYRGGFFANDDGDFMYIAGRSNDERAINMLRDAAKSYGVADEGFPKFLPGRRPISEDDFIEQRARLLAGLTPDILDPGVYRDEA